MTQINSASDVKHGDLVLATKGDLIVQGVIVASGYGSPYITGQVTGLVGMLTRGWKVELVRSATPPPPPRTPTQIILEDSVNDTVIHFHGDRTMTYIKTPQGWRPTRGGDVVTMKYLFDMPVEVLFTPKGA